MSAAATTPLRAAPEAPKAAGKAPAADAKPADKAKPGDGAKAANGAKPDALAVLEANCVKCHGGREVKGRLDLTNREDLLLGSDSGVTVVPGKPADSLLIQVVKHEADPHMPPKGPKLSPEAIATLSDWVKAGVPYPRKVNRTPPADKPGADKGGGDKGGAGGKAK
jgi:mono/diheme cytochrome c family protein